MALTDLANQYVDETKPWDIAKDSARREELHEACTISLNLFRILTLYLKPVMPKLAEEVERFLNIGSLTWPDAKKLLPAGHRINEYKHLMARIEQKQIAALVEANKETLGSPLPPGEGRGGEGKDHLAKKKIPLPPDLLDFARKLRSEQTDAEQLLWSLLRDRRLAGAKFRRQHPVEAGGHRYILDFYSHELKLAIELDGGQHQSAQPRDETRAQALSGLGIKVKRFWNNDVLSQTDSVLESIWNTVNEMTSVPTTAPSPPA